MYKQTSKPMNNIAVFASGNGSNAENIIQHFNGGNVAEVKLVICNKETAPVIQKAQNLGVPAMVFTREELTTEQPEKLLEILTKKSIDTIILAGYLLMIPQVITERYCGRIINIHPALLPKFGGKGMYGMNVHKAVIEAGEKVSGITIHLADAVYDSGKILFQAACPVSPEDSPESLATKVHALEKEHFPAVIEKYIKG